MSEFKYLILRDRKDVEYPVIWPKSNDELDFRAGVSHRDMSRVHSASNVRVVSAGFCTIHPKITAGGRSESLGMESRPEDANVIARYFKTEANPGPDGSTG